MIVNFDASAQIDQASALPVLLSDGGVEFCLITSSTGKWMFPKGFIDDGETYVQTARKEAREEAGVQGEIVGDPLGCYSLKKRGKKLTVVTTLLQVTEIDETWKEMNRRQRVWVSTEDALRQLTNARLRSLIPLALERINERLVADRPIEACRESLEAGAAHRGSR